MQLKTIISLCVITIITACSACEQEQNDEYADPEDTTNVMNKPDAEPIPGEILPDTMDKDTLPVTSE